MRRANCCAPAQRPHAIHNNCSGKHAGMLATAVHLGLEPIGYERPDHPVQIMIARIISETCGIRIGPLCAWASTAARCRPSRCRSRPWPKASRGSGAGEGLPPERASAARRLFHACFAEPVHVAGEGRFDTIVLRALAPSCFTKGGAEGVHCAALPALGLGIALKIDDGAKRGAELAMSEVIAALLPAAKRGAHRSAWWRDAELARHRRRPRRTERERCSARPTSSRTRSSVSARRWKRRRGCDTPRRSPWRDRGRSASDRSWRGSLRPWRR